MRDLFNFYLIVIAHVFLLIFQSDLVALFFVFTKLKNSSHSLEKERYILYLSGIANKFANKRENAKIDVILHFFSARLAICFPRNLNENL